MKEMKREMNSVQWSLGVSGVMLGLTVLAGALGSAPYAQADNVESVTVKINVTCTMSGFDNTYNVSVNPGQTTSDIGPTNIKTVCNDGNGYALYAIGYSGDSYTGNNTKLIGTNGNIDTGTSSSAGNNSYWAMKLSPVTGTYAPTIMNSFDSYHAVPSDFTMVAKYTAATDAGENAEGSTAQAYYEVKSSASQTADTYSGKVKYVLVHPNDAATPIKPLPESACPAQNICYAPNAGDIDGSMSSLGSVTGSDTAGRQASVSTNGTAVLIASNYSRDGYGFAGWSTEFDTANATDPVIFGPNQTITTSTTAGAGDADVSEHGLILYPVWIAGAGTMQSDASTVCSNLEAANYNSTSGTLTASLSSISALTDERDDNTYAIAKLADGNCWMIENLRINADDTLGDTNKALAQGYGTSTTYGNFTGLAPSEDANFSNTNPPVANDLYSTDGSTTNTIQGGSSYDYYTRMPRYNNNNTNLVSNATNSAGTTLEDSYSASNDHARWYGYGNYYTWAAAMASVIEYTGQTSDASGTSLCPTNWQLPRASGYNNASSRSFSYLNGQMGGTNSLSSTNTVTGSTMSTYWRQFPNNFVYSGSFYTASALSRSSGGFYWSSTTTSIEVNAYILYFDGSKLHPGTYNNYAKSHGFSIRCLASS